MKTYIVCLGRDGNAGRKKGAVIHMVECADDVTPTFGSAVKPPSFFIVELLNTAKSDLPADWLEYGGHISKLIVDTTKMTDKETDDCNATQVKVTKTRLGTLKKSNKIAWDAAHAVAEVVEP